MKAYRFPLPSLSLSLLVFVTLSAVPTVAAEWTVTIQRETAPGSGRFHRIDERRRWSPNQTAIIVCDMWDSHHSVNAVRRVIELAPRIDAVLRAARQKGVVIIHAPSGCMDTYRDHPARQRVQTVPKASKLPPQISAWCHRIPAEERGVYPVDQSDGGEDDDPLEQRQWAKQLAAQKRNPRQPWTRQIASIHIDPTRDYISDRGDEIWNILQHEGIRQVVLCGVHTNMCVLGRPFGLRQMVRAKMPVVLLRDLTDTMYNPARAPHVSHFSGTDLIIDYIERYICPTITSSAFLPHTPPFRFRGDRRPHVAIVMAEDEYHTRETLTAFAQRYLQRDCRVSLVYANVNDRNDIPGLTRLRDVDLLILSARRRALPAKQLQWFRRYLASGRPLVAIRTSSHAFHLRKGEPPKGHEQWPTFDQEILGGNYHDHYPNSIQATVTINPNARQHPILAGIDVTTFPAGGSLYKTAPLHPSAYLLAMGSVPDRPAEPIAWTFVRPDGGRTFYAALGHVDDFRNPTFERLFYNAIQWALDRPTDTMPPASTPLTEPLAAH